MGATIERNEAAAMLVERRLAELTKVKHISSATPAIEKAIGDLFNTPSYGFREVVMTCLVAWEISIDFDPVKKYI
jgi:hypothetical protein